MWYYFEWFALGASLSVILGTIFTVLNKENKFDTIINICFYLGIGALAVFIISLWIQLERPPMRTLGETRLWYSFFIMIIGFIMYSRFKLRLFLIYCSVMFLVFLSLNYFMPEIHSKTLMPALQSPWFVPHVIVYMISYALLGLAALMGLIGWYKIQKGKPIDTTVDFADKLVISGFGFLTLGLVFGGLWAKEAWGNFWTWDPKETWALLTWLVYLIYIHYRKNTPSNRKMHLYLLFIGFVVVILCWFGIQYLPVAAHSVHTYS